MTPQRSSRWNDPEQEPPDRATVPMWVVAVVVVVVLAAVAAVIVAGLGLGP